MREDEIREKILQFIDDDTRNWVKAAYYSDPRVVPILDLVYKRWEEAGRKGRPIDYATRDELDTLWNTAKKYFGMSEDTARAIAFSRRWSDEEEGESVFSRLFGRRKKRR